MQLIWQSILFSASVLAHEIARGDIRVRRPQQITPAPTATLNAEYCDNYISTCPPNLRTACVSGFCASCVNVESGAANFQPCCASNDLFSAASCFSSVVAAAAPIDVNQVSCYSALEMLKSCSSAVSGFPTQDIQAQASCLCYVGSTFAPNVFDGLQSACIKYAKTADTTMLSVFILGAGQCSRAGNVRSASETQSGSAQPSVTASIPVATSILPTSSGSIPVATSSLPTQTATKSQAGTSSKSPAYWQTITISWIVLLGTGWLFII